MNINLIDIQVCLKKKLRVFLTINLKEINVRSMFKKIKRHPCIFNDKCKKYV